MNKSHFFNQLLFIITLSVAVLFQSCKPTNREKVSNANLTSYVNPFIGTGGHGHLYPGATVPFGMVQLSPDNGKSGWDYSSGYNYADSVITGFSMTHLSGTGIGDLCDLSFMPANWNDDQLNNEALDKWHVRSTFSHANEQASTGYYTVKLNNGIKVELTAATHAGMFRITFPVSAEPAVALNLGFMINWDKPTDTYMHIENDSTVSGFRMSTGWAHDQKVYFVARFSQPMNGYTMTRNNAFQKGLDESRGDSVKAVFGFAKSRRPLLEKVGISAVSIEGARNNLDHDIPGWNFDDVRASASDRWEKQLDKIKVTDPDSINKTTFYTAFYHTMLAPTIFEDVDGRYRGADGQVHKADNFTNYTTFSLWDTFRAENPLFTIVQKGRVNDMINTMLAFYEQHGLLPVWPLVGNETNTMIAYHSVPVIVDAYLKGFRGFDVQEAYTAMKKSSNEENKDVKMFNSYGYVPCDKTSESVSKTLEYAYDDWCIAQMAKALGKQDDYAEYMKRAGYYKNLYDPSTGFMRPKLSNGNWLTPFDPLAAPTNSSKRNYTEANAWQYLWFVPQDIPALVQLMGGPTRFAARLDTLFSESVKVHGNISDMSGFIGQYVQGNEPDQQTPFLYDYAGQAWRTQEITNKIMSRLYTSKTNGLPGNEDCGQMSAWYVFSAMGFYPVNPASGNFRIGRPLFHKVSISVGQDTTFTIEADGVSAQNMYIQSATLNGEPFNSTVISYKAIMKGGNLVFKMGDQPNKNWGKE